MTIKKGISLISFSEWRSDVANVKNVFRLAIALFAFMTFGRVKANNLTIGTPAVSGANLQVTISWDNSWNTSIGPQNWDAVWVFVKRQSCTNNLWTHAPLSTTSSNHSVTGSVLQVDAASDGMGVYVRRAANGNGSISTATLTLALQTTANSTDNFQVFGIEMVSVPQGDFYIGDGYSTNTFQQSSAPLKITSTINASGLSTNSYYINGYGSTAALPAGYPMGWDNFYCMKYEISQEQYASFLNCLTYTQQVTRTATAPSAATGTLAIANSSTPMRNRIEIMTPGVANTQPAVYACDLNNNNTFNETADGQNIACNWLSWADLIAFLDWAGMRPMTEFEFEKVGRGAAATALADGKAWELTTVTQAESGSISNAGTGSEVSTTTGNGLCAYGANSTTKGPLRCGFAATSSTSRAGAGASYYGIMELSGNVNEQCLGGYNYNYSGFTTANGDGNLTAAGAANTSNWPALGGNMNGSVIRGGNWWDTTTSYLNISDRAAINSGYPQGRYGYLGGRGVRSF